MVRSPGRTCPALARILDDAEPVLLAGFLKHRNFERLTWLERYQFDPEQPDGPTAAGLMLRSERKERLGPLDAEATRIVTIADARGQFALDGLARNKLRFDRLAEFQQQRDELARSLWAYVNESSIFEAAENSLHLRLYRRYDKHYQTFMVQPDGDGQSHPDTSKLELLLERVEAELDRGEGCSVNHFDIPAEGDEPASVMYLLYHPDPPTSVREIDEAGNRSRIYFRPPGEAMIVHTPSTGRVHVRAGSRMLRHTIAENFAATVLAQPLSNQPVDFQAYDISRFFAGFDLELPDLDDVVLLRAKVIRADVSIGNLANRLSLSTSINQDMTALMKSQSGLAGIFERAVAVRFVEIAVRYRHAGSERERTLDFTLTDGNTSSLLSLEDPSERVLGHRLLRHWGILREGRAPDAVEDVAVVPALLFLWDLADDRTSGAWLLDRGVDPGLLTDLGFLVPTGWDDEDLIDDGDGPGIVAAKVIIDPDDAGLRVIEGQEVPAGNRERYRTYRIRSDWVREHLRSRLGNILNTTVLEEVGSHLLYLGLLELDGRKIPVYLARCLHDEHVRAAVDTALRTRPHLGTGLVLQAGHAPGPCLAANVLTPLLDHIDPNSAEISPVSGRLREVFRANRILALGGETVSLVRSGEKFATLFVPGKGSIGIDGANRITVIERLVAAHNAGPMPVSTGDLTRDMGDQSLSNIFKQPLYRKLRAGFIRSPKQGKWEIAV